MNHLEIIKHFKNDRFADSIGATIESIGPDEVVCSLLIKGDHLNAAGKVQGGAIFTLADFAFAVACNYGDLTADQNNVTVSHSSNITFFSPPKGNKLIATTACLQKGRRISVYKMTVTDDLGTNVAQMTGNAYTVSLSKR